MNIHRLTFVVLSACLAQGMAAGAPIDDLLGEYSAAGAGPFTEAAGARLWIQQHPGSKGSRACTSCHNEDPRKPGRHAVTGKLIEPMAPSVNAGRLSERVKIEKWLLRNCKWTLGRECTLQEQGDLLTFLKSQ